MSQKRRIPKSRMRRISQLLDDSFDSSNENSYYSILEIVKRVKNTRQVENITGVKGMSIHSIPKDIYVLESIIEYLEDYYQNN